MPERNRPLTHDDVVRVVGDLEDIKVAAILALDPTAQEIEEAAAWAEAESDVMGKMEMPLAGVAAQIFNILITRKDFGEEERSR